MNQWAGITPLLGRWFVRSEDAILLLTQPLESPDMSTDKLWRILFLAERYGRMTLSLNEVAEQIGLSAGTIKNRRMRGEFDWLRSDGRQLYADVQDVAQYLEEARQRAVEAAAAQAAASSAFERAVEAINGGPRKRRR
jgi:hypothetical protein